ncbi:MAG: fumarate reductase subunit FrdD [Armatimonadota bacterium]|nr:fumarate reductase subunit FrdD [Armatimonadota bacterium]MDR7518562.1 fumarate reductase subunit FrdD [Armatimonadota bacterium]MDR7549924.1 fumarate reductase subunit FrdD [Armatimonadota bacterium]
MRRSTEPLWWLLFAIGGAVAAVLMPVHILLGGVGLAAGWTRDAFAYDRILALASHPLGRLYLFVLIALSLLHWAHRFRYTLAEGLHLKASWLPVEVGTYGTAVVGVALAALALIRL